MVNRNDAGVLADITLQFFNKFQGIRLCNLTPVSYLYGTYKFSATSTYHNPRIKTYDDINILCIVGSLSTYILLSCVASSPVKKYGKVRKCPEALWTIHVC